MSVARLRWYIAAGLMALGWLVQTAFLANLALKNPMVLVTTPFESVIVLSWIVALIGLYLMVRSPRPVAAGMFVLPLVLGLVIVAGWFAPRQSDWLEWGGMFAFWGTVHGIFLLGGAVFTCVAFFAGLMYLVQMRRLKAKRPSRFGLALPSLEQSERINRGAITIAFPLLTFGLLIGMVLSVAARYEGNTSRDGAHTAVDRSQGTQCALDVAGLRGLAPRTVPAGDAWQERDGPDDRGLCLLGVHLGRRRGAAAAHGPWRNQDHDRGEDEDTVRLLALGVDHRSAPASVREALAFDGTKYRRRARPPGSNLSRQRVVILSTCNRVELYVASSPEQVPEISALTDILAKFHGIKSEVVLPRHLVSYHDEGVIGHLFRVAASLESLVLGEGQILGQVREAYNAAVAAEDGRPDLSHRVSDRTPRRQAGPRTDRHGPGQAIGCQRCRRSGQGSLRLLRR